MDNNKQKECNMDTHSMNLWPRCWRQGLGLTALTLLLALSAPALAAIPFELDGNAVSQTGEDWSDFYNNPGYNGDATVNTGILSDRPEAPKMGIFSGGGSKDQQDIPNWKWASGSPPSKDELTHAYAAQYIDDVTGHEILVFGMDRYDTSGDAQLGFWFLQGGVMPVAATPNATKGVFSGEHANGDLLVLVNFSNGGTTPTIQAFKWENGAVVAQGSGMAVLCLNGAIPTGQPGCGITNNPTPPNLTTPSPWPYLDKDNKTAFAKGAFFEGAIDLGSSAADGTCFTNFLTESRSSTSITAVLKDFVAGAFPACSVKVTKACSAPSLSEDGAHINYTITGEVENDGGGMLHEVALSDDPALATAFTVVDCTTHEPIPGAEFPLDTLAGGATVCYKNTFSVLLADNGPIDTVTATAKTAADADTATVNHSATANCTPLQVNPALTIEKSCTTEVIADGNQLVVRVNASAYVCNTGDSALNTVAVTDDHAGLMVGPTSLAKNACDTYTKTYFPSTPDPVVIDGEPTTPTLADEMNFTDKATVTAKDIFGNSVPAGDPSSPDYQPIEDSGVCPLCG